jgi:hypothetical protein
MKKRKSKGKSKQNREDLTVDGSSESSAVVVVISLDSSELYGGWRPEMEEGGRGEKFLGAKKKFWGEIEMTLGGMI